MAAALELLDHLDSPIKETAVALGRPPVTLLEAVVVAAPMVQIMCRDQ